MFKQIFFTSVLFLLLLLIWEQVTRFSSHLLFILPPPSAIFKTLVEHHERLFFHASQTLKEMLGGFFLAMIASFPLAYVMLSFKTSRILLQPFFIVIQCLPMFTLAPLMVIWFGWSEIAILIPTALMIFFPLTLNIYQGFKATPQELLEFFQTNRASSFQTFFKLRLPAAAPHIFAGLRISSAIAGIGAIGGEWAGAQAGLGILMLESRRNIDLEITFSALFLLTVMSFSLYFSVVFVENLFKFRQKIARRGKLVIPFLLFLAPLSSCQKHSLQERRLLLDWMPNPNHIPLYVGLNKGFFQEEGIHFFIQKMHENGGGISYLTSGQTDLLVSHMPSALKAHAKGAQIKVIGTLIKEPLESLIYIKQDSIKQPSDLSGKTLGYCVGGSGTAFLDHLLAQAHITPLEKLNVGIDLISALATKRVDFIYGGYWNIEPFQLESLGISAAYFPLSHFQVPSYNEMIILAQANSKEATAEFIHSFKRALMKSIHYCQKKPSEAFHLYSSYHPDKRSKTLDWERKAWEATYPKLAHDQEIESEQIKKLALWLESHCQYSISHYQDLIN